MNSIWTKVVGGALALATAGTLLVTAAHAQTAPATDYTVQSDPSSDMCGFTVPGKDASLSVVYSAKKHLTALVFAADAIPDITGRVFPVTLVLDNDQYDMKGLGGKGQLIIASDDDSVPAALIAANFIGAKIGEQPVFAVKSDKDFDDAVEKSVVCSQTHK